MQSFLLIFVLAGCGGGATSNQPMPGAVNPPQQATTLDAVHASVTLTLQNGTAVTVSLPKGSVPAFPITVTADANASKLAVVTLTSSGPVTMAAPPTVTMDVPTRESHRVVAESCRDDCALLQEQIVSPSSSGTYSSDDTAPVTLGGAHNFSVTFASLPNYQLVDLASTGAFGNVSLVAINDSETIVANGINTGVVYSNGAWTTIPVPPGEFSTRPYGISNTGVIVGSSGDRAFRSSGGVSSTFALVPPAPNEISQSDVATAISQDGTHVVGYANVTTHDSHGFAVFFTATDFTASGGPAPSSCLNGRSVQGGNFNDSQALAVNSAGTAVGLITDSNTLIEERQVYSCPVQQALGDGTTHGEALGINETGDTVGDLQPQVGRQIPFLYSGGALHELPLPSPFTDGTATAINNSGVIIGSAVRPATSRPGLVWRDGLVFSINDLLPANCVDWRLISALAINNRGDIIGIGKRSGAARAYMLRQLP